jgi:long-chain acyl-CoA synthetase
LAVAKQSEAISLVEIAAESPRRTHQVLEANVSSTPDRVALVEARAWTYLELDRSVTDIAAALKSLGVRAAGDRMIIVSENCIALAAMLPAANRIDGADCNVNRQVLKHKLAESLQSA